MDVHDVSLAPLNSETSQVGQVVILAGMRLCTSTTLEPNGGHYNSRLIMPYLLLPSRAFLSFLSVK